jgi:hypothetical protein
MCGCGRIRRVPVTEEIKKEIRKEIIDNKPQSEIKLKNAKDSKTKVRPG